MGFGPETLAPSVRPTVMAEVLNEKGELEERQFTYPANVYHSFIYYNKNILDKLGVPYPPRDLTWEKYIELAQQLTITRPDSSIPEVFGAAGAGYWPLVWNYGGDAFNADGTRCTIGEKPYINAAIFLHRLYYDFKVEPTPVEKAGVASRGGFGTGYLNWFGEGRVALFWGSRYSLIQLRRFQAEQREARAEYLKRHPHITGVLSVGGWGAEGFSDATATAQGREKLAQSILELMDKHGFRGVDLDWEYPGSSMGGEGGRDSGEGEDYESFMAGGGVTASYLRF